MPILVPLFVVLIVGTNVELVLPQCGSFCVLQEAVVQSAVEDAGVGDHQAPVMPHKHGFQASAETGHLKLSKWSVPVLDHTYTRSNYRLKVELNLRLND